MNVLELTQNRPVVIARWVQTRGIGHADEVDRPGRSAVRDAQNRTSDVEPRSVFLLADVAKFGASQGSFCAFDDVVAQQLLPPAERSQERVDLPRG